jgi:hypothetical protein
MGRRDTTKEGIIQITGLFIALHTLKYQNKFLLHDFGRHFFFNFQVFLMYTVTLFGVKASLRRVFFTVAPTFLSSLLFNI